MLSGKPPAEVNGPVPRVADGRTAGPVLGRRGSAGDHEVAAGDFLVRVELGDGPREDDSPPVHDVDAVRGLVDEVELLLGEKHRDAERLEVADGLHHALRDERGEPLVRLVEERRGGRLAHREGGRETPLGPTSFQSLAGWGIRTASRIDVHVDTVTVDDVTEEGMYFDLVSSGADAGTNPAVPTTGDATWSGAMAAVVTAPGTERHGALVTGDASVTLTGPAGPSPIMVDVAFTNVVSKRTGAPTEEMRWTALPLVDGAFAASEIVPTVEAGDHDLTDNEIRSGIFGEFHGANHEEVGGVFREDELSVAFAARRKP